MISPTEPDCPSNILYICGAGGTGKTTLIEEIVSNNPLFVPADKPKIDRVNYNRDKLWKEYAENTFDYAVRGLKADAERQERIVGLARQSPERIILADRCVLDTLAYILAAERYGDLNYKETARLFSEYSQLFPNKLSAGTIALLDYPVEVVLSNLQRRAETEGASFRDNEPRYHRCVLDSFNTIFSLVDCLRIKEPCQAKERILDLLKEK